MGGGQRRVHLAVVATILITLLIIPLSEIPQGIDAYAPHSPIYIQANDDFTLANGDVPFGAVDRSPLITPIGDSLRAIIETDKRIYKPGEGVQISISVSNSGDGQETLHFRTSCHGDFYVDDIAGKRWFTDPLLCLQVLTQVTVLPHETIRVALFSGIFAWNQSSDSGQRPPVPSYFTITGYVVDYESRLADQIRIAIRDPPTDEPPTARLSVTPVIAEVGGGFLLNASSSVDPDDPPGALWYRWDWEGDGTWDTGWSPRPTTEHRYDLPGTYHIHLKVSDWVGMTSESTGSVVVFVPIAVSPSAQATAGDRFLTISFTAGPSGGKPPYTFLWNFGDGTLSPTENPIHTYTRPGTYTVTLTVTDAEGRSTTKVMDVTAGVPLRASESLAQAIYVAIAGVAVALVIGVFWRRRRH